MDISITGQNGFVAQNLGNYWLSSKVGNVSYISLREDFSNQLNGTAIIHLAGKAHDVKNVSHPDDYFKINRDLTISVFEEFLKSDVRDFFYFSSVKAVKDSVVGILDESFQCDPITPYGQSKLEAERYLNSQNLPVGRRLFIIRPCMIHGPGNKGNLNLLYRIIEKGLPWPLGAYENERSFLGINNLNYLLHKMISEPTVESGTYNFADDKPISTNELISIISETLSKRTKILKIDRRIIEFLSKVGDRISLPLNSERVKKLTESYVVSNKRIKNALNISNLPNSVEEGLRLTVQSFSQK